MKIHRSLNSDSYAYRIVIVVLLLLLSLVSQQLSAQTVSLVQGTPCVGNTLTFSFNGNCSNVTWQVAPSGMYTIISQSNSQLQVKWNSATGGANVTAIYASCNPTANGGTSTGPFSITGSLTPSVSISVNGGSNTVCAGSPLTFTAFPVHGGSFPTYQWYVNGVMRQGGNGANSNSFTWYSFNNGDVVSCSIISVAAGCLTSVGANSNPITVTVNQPTSQSVSIHSWGLPVCTGQTGPGFQIDGAPPSGTYVWYRGANPVADNSPTVPSFVYQPTAPLNNGDQIKLVFTPSTSCSSSSTSNIITATTTQPVQPALTSIGTSLSLPATICEGTNITFTTGPSGSGYSLNYQWTLNGVPVPSNNTNTFSTTSYTNGGAVTVTATASGSCISSIPVPTLTTQGYPIAVLTKVTPSVSLSPLAVNVCAGISVTFAATPSNGGTSPTYSWQVNGAPAPGSTNSSTYTTSSLANNDVVKVIMTSNAQCLLGSATAERTTTSIAITPTINLGSLVLTNSGEWCNGIGSFQANIIDGGNGTYRWYRTRNSVKAEIPEYEKDPMVTGGYPYIYANKSTYPALNGDIIECTFTPNRQCVTQNLLTSNPRAVTVKVPEQPLITMNITSPPPNTAICSGDAVVFKAQPMNSLTISGYTWKLNGKKVAGNNTDTYTTAIFNLSDVVTVRAKANGSCLAGDSTNVVTSQGSPISIVANFNATISPTGSNKIASGASQTITASPTGSGYTYSWYKNGGVISGAVASSYQATQEGNYKVTIENACVRTSSELVLTKNVLPVAAVPPDKTIVLSDDPIIISGAGSDADGMITAYYWTQVSGPSVSLSNTTSTNLVLTDFSLGTYEFQLIVTDDMPENSLPVTIRITVILPTNNYNWIKETTVMEVGKKTESDMAALQISSGEINVNWNYFDGLGRPMQSVVVQGSPGKKDIVKPVIYDRYGREPIKYLPYVSSEVNGLYRTNTVGTPDGNGGIAPDYTTSPQYDFFTNGLTDKIDDDARPLSVTVIEPSPLNRLTEQGAPGTDWQPGTTHTIKKSYAANGSNEIYFFHFNNSTGLLSLTSNEKFYDAYLLSKNITVDEEQNEVVEYIDKQGHTVCKKVQYGVGAGNVKLYASTYYIYDDFGNLILVLPPEAIRNIEQN